MIRNCQCVLSICGKSEGRVSLRGRQLSGAIRVDMDRGGDPRIYTVFANCCNWLKFMRTEYGVLYYSSRVFNVFKGGGYRVWAVLPTGVVTGAPLPSHYESTCSCSRYKAVRACTI